MRYRRSIGVMHQKDWQIIINMLNDYLTYIQQNSLSTNDQINDLKTMIYKLEQHVSRPIQQNYSFNRWS